MWEPQLYCKLHPRIKKSMTASGASVQHKVVRLRNVYEIHDAVVATTPEIGRLFEVFRRKSSGVMARLISRQGCQEYVHLIANLVSRTCGGFAGAMLANWVPTL